MKTSNVQPAYAEASAWQAHRSGSEGGTSNSESFRKQASNFVRQPPACDAVSV
jgi:hypothetical protein